MCCLFSVAIWAQAWRWISQESCTLVVWPAAMVGSIDLGGGTLFCRGRAECWAGQRIARIGCWPPGELPVETWLAPRLNVWVPDVATATDDELLETGGFLTMHLQSVHLEMLRRRQARRKHTATRARSECFESLE